MKIHPTALVHPAAKIADDVEVGPYCVVDAGVSVGPGCRLLGRVTLTGSVTIGRDNVFHYNTAIGGGPQGHHGPAPDGRIEIGEGNVFRETVTVHLPKLTESVTRIGNRNRFHSFVHIAHDCIVQDDVVMGSFATLCGHALVEDGAWVEGQGGIHQFATVGRQSLFRAQAAAAEDIPPFMVVDGNHYVVQGVNPRCRSEALVRAFVTVWRSGLPRPEAIATLEADPDPQVRYLGESLRRTASGRFGRARETDRG